jgi:hypothetical protein
MEEFKAVRATTKYLFEGVRDEQSKQTVLVLGKKVSARVRAFIMIGHGIHHVNVLKERCL